MKTMIGAGPAGPAPSKHSRACHSADIAHRALGSILPALLALMVWMAGSGRPALAQGEGIVQDLRTSSLYVDPDLPGHYSDQDVTRLQGILAAASKRSGYPIKAALLSGAPSDLDAFYHLADDYHDSLNLGKGALILVSPGAAAVASGFFNRKKTEQEVAAARDPLKASLFGGVGFLASSIAEDMASAKAARKIHRGLASANDEMDDNSGPVSAWTGWILVLLAAAVIFFFLHRRHRGAGQQKYRLNKLAARISARVRAVDQSLEHLGDSPVQQDARQLWKEADRKMEEARECINGVPPDFDRCRRLIERANELLNEAQDHINKAEAPAGVK